MIKTAQLSQPLLQRLIHYQLQQSIIQVDETPVQVLNEPGRKAQSQSYMWLYQSGSSGASPPVIIYDYQPGRSGLFAKNYLQDFKGQYLQTDGYSGYAQVCTPQSGIVSVGCWAHAWRKFDEVIKALKGKNVKPGKAHMALNTIAKLDSLLQYHLHDKQPRCGHSRGTKCLQYHLHDKQLKHNKYNLLKIKNII